MSDNDKPTENETVLMALDQISFMMLFTRRPAEAFELYLGDVWLE